MNVGKLVDAGFEIQYIAGCAVCATKVMDTLVVRVRYDHRYSVYNVYLMDDDNDYHVMHQAGMVEDILAIIAQLA